MKAIETILLSLKEKALEATKKGDAPFYRDYLSDDAIAVVPFGVFTKEDIVKQMSAGHSRFKSSRIEDTKAIVLTPQSGIVTYKATFEQINDGITTTSSVFVTTVYAEINGVWKGVFYQQTELQR
ncbi:MAG: nuclear transport factor 2 family protein [Clostridia bacterium]